MIAERFLPRLIVDSTYECATATLDVLVGDTNELIPPIMGIFFRKSVRVGPFRFNLSGAGVGVSVGIPGLRIGTGPRGNYVSAGRGGICLEPRCLRLARAGICVRLDSRRRCRSIVLRQLRPSIRPWANFNQLIEAVL